MSAGLRSYQRTSSSNTRFLCNHRRSYGKILIHRNFAATLRTGRTYSTCLARFEVSFRRISSGIFRATRDPLTFERFHISCCVRSRELCRDSTNRTDELYRRILADRPAIRVRVYFLYNTWPVSLWRYEEFCKRGRARKATRFSCNACIEARTRVSDYRVKRRLEVDYFI